jgi:hypothetical protein
VTDQRLRDLERDAAHGGLQAGARLLLERVRVGDLTEERLRLAAYLGHEAARGCVPVEANLEPGPWLQALCGLSREIAVRVALVASRWAWRVYEASEEFAADSVTTTEARHGIEIAEAWLLTREAQEYRFQIMAGAWLPPPVVRAVAGATSNLARTVDPGWHDREPPEVWAARAVQALLGAAAGRFKTEPIRSSFEGIASFAEVTALLAEELIPWALASRGSST